jgi:hypothetical protein
MTSTFPLLSEDALFFRRMILGYSWPMLLAKTIAVETMPVLKKSDQAPTPPSLLADGLPQKMMISATQMRGLRDAVYRAFQDKSAVEKHAIALAVITEEIVGVKSESIADTRLNKAIAAVRTLVLLEAPDGDIRKMSFESIQTAIGDHVQKLPLGVFVQDALSLPDQMSPELFVRFAQKLAISLVQENSGALTIHNGKVNWRYYDNESQKGYAPMRKMAAIFGFQGVAYARASSDVLEMSLFSYGQLRAYRLPQLQYVMANVKGADGRFYPNMTIFQGVDTVFAPCFSGNDFSLWPLCHSSQSQQNTPIPYFSFLPGAAVTLLMLSEGDSFVQSLRTSLGGTSCDLIVQQSPFSTLQLLLPAPPPDTGTTRLPWSRFLAF